MWLKKNMTMKAFKYLAIALVAVIGLSACEKHELTHPYDEVGNRTALFQVFYFAPVTNGSANYIDSVYVNDVLYSSANGSGQLATYNGIPGGGVGRFFGAAPGDIRLRFMKKGVDVYEKVVTLQKGKQGIFVYDFNENPVVIPLPSIGDGRVAPTAATYDTDSVCYVRFINFLYENPTTPYPGKLQYQWMRHNEDMLWENVGEPVGFGEATQFEMITVHKETYNSWGSQRIDYRVIDESGKVLQVGTSASKLSDYGDWWTGTLGRAHTHTFSGVRVGSPACAVRVWAVR